MLSPLAIKPGREPRQSLACPEATRGPDAQHGGGEGQGHRGGIQTWDVLTTGAQRTALGRVGASDGPHLTVRLADEDPLGLRKALNSALL